MSQSRYSLGTHLWVPLQEGDFSPEVEQDLDAKFSVRSKYDGGPHLRAWCMGRGSSGDIFIGLPRGAVPLPDEPVEDHRVDGWFPDDLSLVYPARNSDQAEVESKSHKLLDDGRSFILQATTGFGKTWLASSMIAHTNRQTLVVVTKEDLMLQWKKELIKFLGLSEGDIGIARQNKCDFEGKPIVLGMLHSLVKDKYPQTFKDHFGMVVFDEVHRMGAETFSLAAPMFRAKIRVGLSATVKRPDGMSRIFQQHIGPTAITHSEVSQPLRVIGVDTGVFVPPHLADDPGRMMKAHKFLAGNRARNEIILGALQELISDSDRHCILFSDLKGDHLKVLGSMLDDVGLKNHYGYYTGGMTESTREKSKSKRIILATYQMTAEATDIPRLDTAIFATPRVNITQPVGRILREHPEKNDPLVIDLVDKGEIFRAFFNSRLKRYRELGAKISER